MLYKKSCPKCRGDMYQDEDFYGAYQGCLQCGYVRELAKASTVTPEPTASPPRGRKLVA